MPALATSVAGFNLMQLPRGPAECKASIHISKPLGQECETHAECENQTRRLVKAHDMQLACMSCVRPTNLICSGTGKVVSHRTWLRMHQVAIVQGM